MFMRLAMTALLIVGWTAGRLPAGDLSIGDPAPKFEVKEFVKGEPVAHLEKGKTYVIEFWATWCGPCKASIPHLTELQKKFKDVIFIGVSTLERDPKGVKPFVEKMGEEMAYRVALDLVPEGGKPDEGKMAKGWLDAADQEGIPTAFIVNGAGQIAWIGHPMEMEKPLGDIVAGKYDLKAATAQFKEERAQARRLKDLQKRVGAAMNSGGVKAGVAVLDEEIKKDPKLEESLLGLPKFSMMLDEAELADKAVEYGKRLVETVHKDNVQNLNTVAWLIVDPQEKRKAGPALLKVALTAAKRADELAKAKNPEVADTLARVYFAMGDAAKALETQQRAVDLAKGTELEQNADLKARLEEYRKAAKK
jgi:thiol-disulfide isomerase/thioredoxin